MSRPTAALYLPINPRLKDRIFQAAAKEHVPANEWVSRVLAGVLGCESLAAIPRRRSGPKKAPP